MEEQIKVRLKRLREFVKISPKPTIKPKIVQEDAIIPPTIHDCLYAFFPRGASNRHQTITEVAEAVEAMSATATVILQAIAVDDEGNWS